MREVVSSILKLGVINSGMFDTLELNTDVRAIHLVGDNNVGKTSLIELIQFLAFPDLREMHFSKSLPETLAFYFRPEGSYVLFTVRTVRGTQRTLGIHGTGSANSRQVFAFDGAFVLADFLDEERHVLPLQRLGIRLADRRFYLYARPEDHERALIGEQSEDQANVQIFDLGHKNVRLLRRLLQNLLRLERLTARDIRLFLNALVESTGAKTRIDVSRDFERKYAETRSIRDRIASLSRLKPLIDQWAAADERVMQATAAEQAARVRLSHGAQRYAELLAEQQHDVRGRAAAISAVLADLEEQRQQLANQIAMQRSHAAEIQRSLEKLQELTAQCAHHREEDVRAERDRLSYQATDLQERLTQASRISLAQIERRLREAHESRTRIQRLIEDRTISHLLAEMELSDEQRALLRFLLSERLLSLPLAEGVADAAQFLAAAHAAAAQVDADGVFHGAGLHISRTVWYRPPSEEEPLADRLLAIEERIIAYERELAIARDQEQAQHQIRSLQRQIAERDALLSALQRRDELERSSGGAAALTRAWEACRRTQQELEAEQRPLQARVGEQQDARVALRSEINTLQQHLDEVHQVGREIGDTTTPCPADIASMAPDDLPELFRRSRERHRDQSGERRRAEAALHEPRPAGGSSRAGGAGDALCRVGSREASADNRGRAARGPAARELRQPGNAGQGRTRQAHPGI